MDAAALRRLTFLEPLWRDLRHAGRSLMRTPALTAVAVTTLAICLGANLTIFSVVDDVLLRPLPFPAANRLVTVINSFPRAGKDHDGASLTSYYEWRGHLPAFSSMAALEYATAIIGDHGTTERLDVVRVTPDFFATLGTGPALGRAFTEAETTPGQDDSVVITDEFGRQRFASPSAAIGHVLRVDGRMHTIVGVLPPGFHYLSSDAQIVLPLSSGVEARGVNNRYVSGTNVIARLTPGATLGEAQDEIEAHYRAHAAEFPWAKEIEAAGFRVTVVSLHADQVAAVRPTLLLLQIGALLLLLTGGVNLVNLLLIRASGRSHEMAIRQSLGASRRDVIRQVMAETTLLALGGSLAGLLAGAAGIRLLSALGVRELPLAPVITLDARAVLVALMAALAVGGIMALPVIRLSLRGPLPPTAAGTRTGTATRAAQRFRHGLIVAQIALAFMLLAGAGLLGLSLERATSIAPGFRPDHVLTGRVTLPRDAYPGNAARTAFTARVVDELAHEPGVSAAGVITEVPVNGPSEDNAMTVIGYVPPPGVSPILHNRYGVTGGYFPAMGIPLRGGRFLDTADSTQRRRVCVVDEVFARHYWPTGHAIGQLVFDGPPQNRARPEAFTVVGVVGSVAQSDLTDRRTTGAIYFPFWYDAKPAFFLAVRTARRPESLAMALRQNVRHIDPELPVDDVRSMDIRIDDSLTARRSPALLAGLFAAIALLLAAIGTYGVLSFAVARRRREIGVRLALGARPGHIARQFLTLGLRLLGAGTLLGLAGAWMASRALQHVLFGVSGFPAAILAGTAAVMTLVALAACLVPSRRAARLAPTEALSRE